jgi:hypothetical protein
LAVFLLEYTFSRSDDPVAETGAGVDGRNTRRVADNGGGEFSPDWNLFDTRSGLDPVFVPCSGGICTAKKGGGILPRE